MKWAFFVLCIGVGAYQTYGYWKERKAEKAHLAFAASEPKNRAASQAGFVDAIQPNGTDPNVMTVFMPVGCPLEAGRRGRALIDRMKAAGIPETASSSARCAITAKTKAEFDAKVAQMNRIMQGETPIVFFRGRAENNPTFEDVLLEYRTSK